MSSLLHTFEGTEWFKVNSPRTVFHRCKKDSTFETRLESSLSNIEIFPGLPDQIIEIENAIVMPGKPTVWNRYGARISESCVRRGPNLSQYVWAGEEKIDVPENYDFVDEKMVYLSFLPNEWGHFLLESLSRLWAIEHIPTLSDTQCFYGYKDFKNISFVKFFEYAGINKQRIVEFKRPTIIKNCLIPLPSFSIRAQAYEGHCEILRKVANRILDIAKPQSSEQPVYLSRSKIKRGRVVRNEVELENRLVAVGVRVVYPEELSFEQQVILFNTHTHFLGCWGSAFHNLLFSVQPDKITTHIMCEDIPNANYLMADAILNNSANYIQALFHTPGVTQTFPNTDCMIDVDIMINYLKKHEIVR